MKNLTIGQQIKLIVPPVALALVLALLIPPEWNASNGPLHPFTKSVMSVVPSITRFTEISSFPGITSTTLACLWAAAPALVFWLYRQRGLFKIDQIGELKHKIGFVCMLTLFVSPMILLPLLCPVSVGDIHGGGITEVILRLVSHSRVGLGLISGLVMWGWALAAAILIHVIKNSPRLFFGI
jgi:hypothetical protein